MAELATQRVDSGSAPFGQMSIFPKDIFRTLLSRRKCDLVIKLTSLFACRLNASALADATKAAVVVAMVAAVVVAMVAAVVVAMVVTSCCKNCCGSLCSCYCGSC